MKCREAQYWLYSFQPNAAWPADVVGHLQGCAECQQVQAHLRKIDHEVNRLTSLPHGEAPKEQLLKRVALTPQDSLPKDVLPKTPWPWLRYGTYLSGAAALIVIGWLMGEFSKRPLGEPIEKIRTEFVDVVRERIITVQSHADRSLVALLLKRNSRLVQTSQVKDRVETLLDMADDCRQHALTLIEQGPRDQLPLTIDLYSHLLRDGVVVQLAQAPMEQRPALQTAVRVRVEKMAAPAAAGSPTLPRVVAEQCDALQNAGKATLDLVDRLENGEAPVKPQKWQRVENAAPALALVQFAITFASEGDAVAKADACANSVKQLMPFMMLYLAEDSIQERGEMGQQFGEMIQFGVYKPLEVAAAQEPAPPVMVEAERVFENAGKALLEIEKNWQQAPDAAKVGLERALDATWQGWQKSKGKGPPALRNPLVNPEKKTPGKGKGSKDQKRSGLDDRDPSERLTRTLQDSKMPARHGRAKDAVTFTVSVSNAAQKRGQDASTKRR